MVYAINYDLKKPGRDYKGLHEAIKGCGAWWHNLGSTWLVDTTLDAEGVWKRLEPHFDKNDRALDRRQGLPGRSQRRPGNGLTVGAPVWRHNGKGDHGMTTQKPGEKPNQLGSISNAGRAVAPCPARER